MIKGYTETCSAINIDVPNDPWTTCDDLFHPIGYCCEVRLVPDNIVGGFIAYLPELPGVVGEGETFESAMLSVAESAKLCLRSYLDDGLSIPWISSEQDLECNKINQKIMVYIA